MYAFYQPEPVPPDGPTSAPIADVQTAAALVQSVRWYHRFEVIPGLITPGVCDEDAAGVLDTLGFGRDLSNQTILEIGTWDGMFAFELERRGANVIAVDIQDPMATGFHVASRLRRSRIRYLRCSVYELATRLQDPVDAVLFKGVLYHLKHPLLALENIWQVLKPGGMLHVETEGFSHYAETLEARWASGWLLLAALAYSHIPMTLACPGRYKGYKNWFIPNAACLRSWLLASGFEPSWIRSTVADVRLTPHRKLRYILDLIRHVGPRRHDWGQRLYGVATRLACAPVTEHHLRQQRRHGPNAPRPDRSHSHIQDAEPRAAPFPLAFAGHLRSHPP